MPIQIDSGFMAWVHPLQSESDTYHMHYTVKAGTNTGVLVADGHFDVLDDTSLVRSYPAADCIMSYNVYQLEYSADVNGRKHTTEHSINCYARNIGIVFYTETNVGNRKLYLKKRISATEFDQMKQGDKK